MCSPQKWMSDYLANVIPYISHDRSLKQKVLEKENKALQNNGNNAQICAKKITENWLQCSKISVD